MKKRGRFVYWTPRIVSIIFVAFLALFSLDIFDSCSNFWNCSGGLFMHNIPVFILALLLWWAWKREIVGAATFFFAGLLYIIFVLSAAIREGFEFYHIAWIVQISGIAFFIAILFLIGWKRRR